MTRYDHPANARLDPLRTWGQRFTDALAIGRFDAEAKLASENWETCAVSQLFGTFNRPMAELGISCSKISGLTKAEVERLERMGFALWDAVISDRVEEARGIFDQMLEFAAEKRGVTS